MAQKQKTWNDGDALTTVELNRDTLIGAQADDVALSPILTPGSIQKRVLPLSEETTALNPRLLVIPSPGGLNGELRVLPALFVAGTATKIAASWRVDTALDTALIGANSSGSTRYDLIYATLSYAVSVNASRKVKSVTTAQVSTQPVNLELAPQVTLTILPNVAQGTPLATMPADGPDGSGNNVWNFGLALVTVANGYTSGTAITQANIAPLWSGGFVARQRVSLLRPGSICTGAANERLAAYPFGSRWGVGGRVFLPFRRVSGTPSSAPGIVLDNSIDWRARYIELRGVNHNGFGNVDPATFQTARLMPGAALSDNGGAAGAGGVGAAGYSGGGGGTFATINYNNANAAVVFYIDATTGALMFYATGTIISGANGDLFTFIAEYTDQFVSGQA